MNKSMNFLLITGVWIFLILNGCRQVKLEDNTEGPSEEKSLVESKMFLQNPKPNDAQRIHTDNKMGLEILAGLCNYFNNCQLIIDIHTNAWEYTASELVENNITSYFFVHSIR